MIADLPKLTDLNYMHRYFVDGSPTVGDVFYNSAWHTLLVAGMRAGAKGLFALDVTDPSSFTRGQRGEHRALGVPGPRHGLRLRPAAPGQDQQRPLVGGRERRLQRGNTSGHAFLFVIDAETGSLVAKIDTGSGTAASPNGLSAPGCDRHQRRRHRRHRVRRRSRRQSVEVRSLQHPAGKLGAQQRRRAAVRAGAGHAITARPDITKFTAGGYLVAFGTGRYVASADNTDLTTQRIYAVRDTGNAGTVSFASLLQQSITGTGTGGDGNTYRFSTHAVGQPGDYVSAGDNTIDMATYQGAKSGWYVNLPDSGERVVADARFRGGRAIFTSLVPDVSSPCAYGGSGWVIELDAMTGNRLDSPTFDTNGDNTLTTADFVSRNGLALTATNTSGRQIGSIPAAPGFMSNRSGGVTGLEDKFINTSDGSVVRVRETAGAGRQGRVMWHEVR